MAMELGFWRLAEREPDHVAVVTPDGREVTAGALLASANRLVHSLRARGLRRGDAVAVVLKNDLPILEVFLACAQAGFYMAPINTHLAPPEIAYIVGDSGAKAVVCSAEVADVCRTALDSIGFSGDGRFCTGDAAGFRPFSTLSAGQPDATPADRIAGMPMTYSSGTTGRPKGVRRPIVPVDPETMAGGYAQFLMLFGMQPRDGSVHLVTSPLYHTAVLSFCSNHLHMGHRVVLMDKWTPEGTLERIERFGVTTTHMVPTQFSRLLALPEAVRAERKLGSLRQVIHSAAPCPVDVKRRMLAWWGPVIFEYYAASEGGGTLARPAEWLEKPGTVGKAWPISKLRIVRDDGTEAAAGEPGTVFMSMGQHRFEYHNDPKKTDGAWKGEFFTVGDVGYLDADGYLFLCDRKCDMIISGGVNVYPAEIESVLLSHPEVADCAVFGIPDDDWGERIKAVVELAPGVSAGPDRTEALLAFCKERLAAFKLPRSIDFTDAMPRDPSGKLYKRKLRDPYWVGRERAI